jgi:Leucine-rich repeat (LRR) protein
MSCEILKHLPNLEYLDLYGNSIELTDPGLFKYSNKLKFLRLERNKSADLSQFCLDDLTYLERFSLNFNSLNSIQAFNGKNCGNIVCLNLSNNELTCLPAKAFSNLHNLVNLNLSHNKIAEIEAGGFDGLVNLRSLDLAYNLLESLDLNIFDSVDNMPPVNLLVLNIHMWNLKSVTYMASATKTHRMGFFSQCRNTVFIRVHKSLMEDTSLIDELVGNGRVYLETENDL